MARKIYDITTGHYVVMLNEDEQDTSFNAPDKNGDNDAQEEQKEEQQQTNKSVEENPQIQQLNTQADSEKKRYETSKDTVENAYQKQM